MRSLFLAALICTAFEAGAQTTRVAGPPSATPSADLQSGFDDAWSMVDPAPARAPSVEARPDTRLIKRRSNSTGSGTNESANTAAPTAAGGWPRTIASLGGVVAVILFLAWGTRILRGMVTPKGRARRPGMIEIISRTSLSQRQSLCLVRVGPRMVLVGITAERLQALDVISDEQTVAALAGEAIAATRKREEHEFVKRLESENAEYADAPPMRRAAAAGSADDLRERLKSSVARLRNAASR